MASFGHSGSHAPQLMHSSVIKKAIFLSPPLNLPRHLARLKLLRARGLAIAVYYSAPEGNVKTQFRLLLSTWWSSWQQRAVVRFLQQAGTEPLTAETQRAQRA